jgi:hypothetical protein
MSVPFQPDADDEHLLSQGRIPAYAAGLPLSICHHLIDEVVARKILENQHIHHCLCLKVQLSLSPPQAYGAAGLCR